VNVAIPPTLSDFLRSDHAARLVIGPFGSGKSSACIAEFLRRAQGQAPGKDGIRRTRFAAVRNTYPQLRDTTRKTFDEWMRRFTDGRPDRLGHWRERDFTFVMKFNDVESEILFRSLDTPDDVGKLLSLELTGAYINEWREIAKEIFEGLTGRIGRFPAVVEGGPTWRGIWGDTNPWHPTHWVPLLAKKHPETIEIFRQPGGRSAKAENVENLEPGYYDRLCVGKDDGWIRVYVDGQDAEAAVGSIYGNTLARLRARGGVEAFEHDEDEVFTAWDFGIADSMAVWWFRFSATRGVDVIDWYENSGLGLPHYFAECDRRGYKYVAHYLPHDARARSWHTGRSAVELFEEWAGAGDVLIAPELSVDDGIGAARWLLEQQTTRFHVRCDEVPKDRDLSGLGTLAEYKFVWDETHKVFSKNPLHNFASHSADAFRVLACAVKHGEIITRAPEPPKVVEPPMVLFDKSGMPHLNRTFKQLADATINRRPRREHV
jgi:hypothetical protein